MSPRRAKRPATGFVLAALVLTAALVAAPGCTPLEPRVRNITGSSRSGVYHVVHKGETLWRISRTYGVSVVEIREANDLPGDTIRVGQKLFVPGASRLKKVAAAEPMAERKDTGGTPSARLAWPLAGRGRGSVTSGFGYRDDPMTGGRMFHKGIDIDGAREERVLAAAAGETVYSGRMSGYGTVVMIDHGDRTITVYAHLSRAVVRLEEKVSRGQTIGYVGSTGRATGTHLHFEVRYKGRSVDPLQYLP